MIFRPDSIRLIEAGLKTQTRRPVRRGDFIVTSPHHRQKWMWFIKRAMLHHGDPMVASPPLGVRVEAAVEPGDQRDMYAMIPCLSMRLVGGEYVGQGDIERVRAKWRVGHTYAVNPPPPKGSKARMGRQVGRILLKEIRCERVCDISDKDVPAEGLRWNFERGRWMYGDTVLEKRCPGIYLEYPASNVAAYLFLWRSLYKKSDCTELCWALTFERVA